MSAVAPVGAAAGSAPDGVDRLRHELAARGLDLVRAWPRSDAHLLLHVRGTGGPPGTWVAAQWFADVARAASVARATPGASLLAGTGVVLQPDGADRRLVGLRGLLAEPGALLVAHRPERRAVLRRTTPDGAHVWTKVVPPPRAGALLASAGWCPAGVRVPEVVAVDLGAGAVTTAALPGTTLHARADHTGSAADEAAWCCAGQAVAALHRSAPPAGAARHGVADEADVTLGWLARAQQHGALDAGRLRRYRAVVDAAVADLAAAPGRVVALHRDLHDKQVVVDGTTAALLDLDLVAVGEPAVDVANLLVHLVLRDEQAALHPGPARPRCASDRARAFLAGYDGDLDPARLQALAVLAAVRVAAVYAFREPFPPGPPGPPGLSGPVAASTVEPPVPAAGRSQDPAAVPDGGGTEVGDRLVRSVLQGLPGT